MKIVDNSLFHFHKTFLSILSSNLQEFYSEYLLKKYEWLNNVHNYFIKIILLKQFKKAI